jgi:predicted Zn-dependent protease
MNESELLSHKRCEEVLLAAQSAAYKHGVADVEVLLTASSESLTRFANNAIHQNVSERSVNASVRVALDGRTARATTNHLHREGIQQAVDSAVMLARANEPFPYLQPLYECPDRIDASRYSQACAVCTPTQRATAVAEAIRIVESHGQAAAGIYSTAENAEALLNSRGLFHYYVETLSTFSITAMAGDSSGWAKASATVHEEVDPVKLAMRAAKKAARSSSPVLIDPGLYTVILEPAAVLDLVGQIFADFSATAIHDERSFLVGRVDEELFGPNITIYDDVHFPMQSGAPFDGEGVPRKSLTLVRHGVIEDIPYSRAAAAREDADPTGHGFPLPNEVGEMPANIVIAGGKTCLEDMVRATANGILVTRLWYIRETEPFQKSMTGMTRDGTFLIRDGEIASGIRNMRFNVSVIDLLKNVEALSPSVRASGEEAFDMVVPAMKVRDFHFTEATKF